MSELVSIITPVYNVEKYIEATIASVQSQTYTHWEHILVDDCSTDASAERIKALSNSDSRLRYFKLNQNSGPAVARNVAIEKAKGRFLAFLDADDIWFDFHLKDSINYLLNHQVSFVFASYKRSDEALNLVYSNFIVPQKVSYTDILKTNSISCLTAVVDIQTLGKKKMPLIRKRQDMGLWLKYLKVTKYAYGIQKPHAIYRIRKSSLSRNKKALLKYQWEFYRHVEKLSVVRTIYYLVLWMYNGFLKYRK